jgi:septum formation protein
MLQKLSGRKHQVITGVCVMTKDSIESYSDTTEVFFRELTDAEIDYYIENCKPFDKAGSYGVQDFVGMVGIPRIEGSILLLWVYLCISCTMPSRNFVSCDLRNCNE